MKRYVGTAIDEAKEGQLVTVALGDLTRSADAAYTECLVKDLEEEPGPDPCRRCRRSFTREEADYPDAAMCSGCGDELMKNFGGWCIDNLDRMIARERAAMTALKDRWDTIPKAGPKPAWVRRHTYRGWSS